MTSTKVHGYSHSITISLPCSLALTKGKDDLVGYSRIRVQDFWVIYRETLEGGERVVKCLFAQRRNLVYELFAQMVLKNFPA